MEATVPGLNRTGAQVSPEGTQAMTEAVHELTPEAPINTGAMEAERIVYINEADAVGSIPLPPTAKGLVKSGVAKLKGGHPSILMDKLGERIAFERGGTRLYDALLAKYQATQQAGPDALPAAEDAVAASGEPDVAVTHPGERPAQTLARIRDEELAHFRLCCAAMVQLGGDPTAQTPCADVGATASMGLIQVLTDPRTTLAQCLNAILIAELADNAGWELLIALAEDAGESELAGRFLAALSEEQEHLATIKGWLTTLVLDGAGSPAV